MAENPSNRDLLETDDAISSTGGLPPDFFDVPESSASDRHAQSLPARNAPLPSRLAAAPASPHVVIERRTSFPVVLVVVAGNIAFFLGGGLAGWAAARKGAAHTEPPATAATNLPLSEVVRAIDAKASKSALDALSSRIGEVQSELGTLGRELARLEDRLNARTKLEDHLNARINAPPPPAPLDLAPLRTRIDQLVEESQRLSPLPATFQSLRQRVDALDKSLNALRTEVAAVPKQIDASLNALKDAMVSRPAPDQVSPADLGRDLGAVLFRQGKYPAAREVFLTVVQNYPNDARLWYFAALANGLTSGDWAGESERMVRRGLECEQGGRPNAARTSTPNSRR